MGEVDWGGLKKDSQNREPPEGEKGKEAESLPKEISLLQEKSVLLTPRL